MPQVPSPTFTLPYLWLCVRSDLWGDHNITETLQSAELFCLHGARVGDDTGLLGKRVIKGRWKPQPDFIL